MRKIHDPNEYNKYKSVTGSDNNHQSKVNSNYRPTGLGWVVIGIVIFMLILFISDGASKEAISTLLGFGFIAYLFTQWISK